MLLPLRAAILAAEFAARVPTIVDPAALLDGDLGFHTARTAQARAIVLATGDKEEQIAPLAKIAMLAKGAGEQPGVLSNLLGAVAGAWALGVAPDLIRAGVKPYNPSAPLRAD